MSKLPAVAIVGRPNVGKSSLLNALAGKLISIVQDMPGVTRDRVSAPIQLGDKWIELVDTGGYGFIDPQQLTEHINEQIEIAMTRANLVLLVVDCSAGLTAADQEIALLLRNRGVKTVVIANKADSPKADTALAEFSRLGFGTPIGVSATADRNIDQLLETIQQNVDLTAAPTEVSEPQMLVAIVGKRNAGKSTLVNAIARIYEDDPQRVIVSEVAGTTRDSVDVRFEKDGKALTVIDTAGVRKKRMMVSTDLDFYSFHRAQRSIRRADVVILLVDGAEPISEPDRKLAQYLGEQEKPVLLVVNKWDLSMQQARAQRTDVRPEDMTDEKLMGEFVEYLHTELHAINFAPVAFITAKTGKNVQMALDLTQHLFKQATNRVSTGRLNAAVKDIFEQRIPSTPRGQRAKILYATQVDVQPPTIVLFVNHAKLFDDNYQRFVINRFRETLPFGQVPIRLMIRGREQTRDEIPVADAGEVTVVPRPKKPRPKPRATKRR